MFQPNRKCRIQLASGKSDVYGQPRPGRWITEPCAIVQLKISNEKSSVRADSSASRGNAMELNADAVLLLSKATKANIDDVLELQGYKLRITARVERFDTVGNLDHFEIHANIWSAA